MEMYVHSCARCGQEIKIPAHLRGTRVSCPRCQGTFTARPPGPAPTGPGRPGGRPGSAKRSPSEEGPKGFGGWLVVAIVWIVLGGLGTLYFFLMGRYYLSKDHVVRSLRDIQGGDALEYFQTAQVINGVLLFGVLAAVIAIAVIRPYARAIVIAYLFLNIGAGVYDYIWCTELLKESTLRSLDIHIDILNLNLLGRFVGCGILILYFGASERVKNTFARDST